MTHYAEFIAQQDLVPLRAPVRADGDSARGMLMFLERNGSRNWAVTLEWARENGRWYATRFVQRGE